MTAWLDTQNTKDFFGALSQLPSVPICAKKSPPVYLPQHWDHGKDTAQVCCLGEHGEVTNGTEHDLQLVFLALHKYRRPSR